MEIKQIGYLNRLNEKLSILSPFWSVQERKADGVHIQHVSGLSVIASVAKEDDGKYWLHVSMSYINKMPSYKELVQIKELLIGVEEYAIMIFPTKQYHVNLLPTCLHLFHCLEGYPLPEFSGFVKGVRTI